MTQLVIMAGVHGTRFNNICTHTNKCFLPIDGKPIIQHIIESVNVNNVIIGTWTKYENQFKNYSACKNANIKVVESSSSIETCLKLKDYIKEDFFLSVADGYSKEKLITPKYDTFYIKEIKDSIKYNTIVANELSTIKKIYHFEETGLGHGLTGLFYIKNHVNWFKSAEKAIKQGLRDRDANNFVFTEFIKMTEVKQHLINWSGFDSIEDYLMYAKA